MHRTLQSIRQALPYIEAHNVSTEDYYSMSKTTIEPEAVYIKTYIKMFLNLFLKCNSSMGGHLTLSE